MAKFNNNSGIVNRPPARAPKSALKTKSKVTTVTHEGAPAVELKTKAKLFTLGVTNMVSENTFYESGADRDARYRDLVAKVTKSDPEWVGRFLRWLRNYANMRSASLVGAAEYVRAGGPNGRQVVASVLQRADEPGELLAYWTSNYGRKLPQPIKRGVADATLRLYNEYSVQKYDSDSRGFRFADVIQLTHPRPQDAVQGELFKYALDRRYQGSDAVPAESLSMLWESKALDDKARSAGIESVIKGGAEQQLKAAGWTWERLSSYGKFTKETWEAIIPTMGYMALLRNLRNFEQVGVSEPVMRTVRDRLRDPELVARSKQLPFRFYSAFRHVTNTKTKAALEEAFEASFGNFEFPGRTLVLVDTSGSMFTPVSGNSELKCVELGAIFGVATALAIGGDVAAFGTDSKRVVIRPGASALASVDKVESTDVGWSTNMGAAVAKQYDGHDRVIIFTDMQSHDIVRTPAPTYLFDLRGYGVAPYAYGGRPRKAVDGLTILSGYNDQMLKSIPLLERGVKGDWPF
jgi:hypothetical protein